MKETLSARPSLADRALEFELEGRSHESAGASARLEIGPARGFITSAGFPPRDFQTSLRLLECAGRAMEILYDRRNELETSLKAVSRESAHTAALAEAKVLDWQRHAAAARSETQELERQLAALRQRVEVAETQLEAQRSRAILAERQVSESFAMLDAFHSRVLSMFGPEARAHKALMVVAEWPKEPSLK